MTDSYIALDQIRPNPWQPRQVEDAEEVQKLAQSIAEIGLLQTPLARAAGDGAYELAFGHRRLAAYRLLRDQDGDGGQKISNYPSKWGHMPLIIQALTDEEMFRMAISENLKRQDLNPLEEARSMARYRDEFGKTSAEIGELFGLSDSAVRNKIRLLQLPEDVQSAVMERRISERALRELLGLFNIPEDIRSRAASLIPSYFSELLPSSITRAALNGATSEEIHELVHRMLGHITISMDDAVYKHDRAFDGDEYHSPACKSCDRRFVLDSGVFCGDKDCFEAKQRAAGRELIEEASRSCGIPAHDNPQTRPYELTTFWSDEKAHRIRSTGCENLRLVYSRRNVDHVEGYPHAELICIKRSGQCVCERVLNTGVDVVEEPIEPQGRPLMEVFGGGANLSPDPSPSSGGEMAPAIVHKPLTAEELREIDRKTRKQKRENLAECRGIREVATQRIYQGLEERNPAIWLEVTRKLIRYSRMEELAGAPVLEMWLALAERIASDMYDWTYREPDPAVALRVYNELLRTAGLPEIEAK